MRPSRANRLVMAVAAAAVSLLASRAAVAEERPFFVGGGGGGAIRVDNFPTQGLAVQELGWHVLGRTDGFYIGLSFAEGFGNGVFAMQVGGRFGYDLRVLDGPVGLMLSPSVMAGVVYAAISVETPYGQVSGDDAAFDVQAAFDVRVLLLGDRLALFARPASLDFFVDAGVGIRWNVIAGACYQF